MTFDYPKVSEVVETSSYEETNEYLQCGWVLLNAISDMEGQHGFMKYSLGWDSSRGEKKTPENQCG